QQVQWGLGWALGLVAAAGTLYAIFEMLRSLFRFVATWIALGRRNGTLRWLSDAQMANLVVWSWVLPYFGITGAFLAKFNRYMSPVLPFVLLWGAWLIVVLWRAGARGEGRVAAWQTTESPEQANVPELTEASELTEAPELIEVSELEAPKLEE